MLTVDMLKMNAALQGLTEEQLNAVAEMSRNDENTVIGNRIGALHGQYDADIMSITGEKKNDGEKSYDFAKRVLTAYKTKIAELEDKAAKGAADDAIRQQLKDAKAQVTQLQTQLSDKDKAIKDKQEEFDRQLKSTHVDYAFRAATAGLTFKKGITPAIQQTLINAAKAEILAKGTPDFIDDGKGGKTLVFRSADGNIINNPNNNLNPYTIGELVMETALKDVIDNGRRQTGGGTGGSQSNNNNKTILDLSGAKSQVEADRLIEGYLLSNGITRESSKFAEQSLQLRNDNNVSQLPIK